MPNYVFRLAFNIDGMTILTHTHFGGVCLQHSGVYEVLSVFPSFRPSLLEFTLLLLCKLFQSIYTAVPSSQVGLVGNNPRNVIYDKFPEISLQKIRKGFHVTMTWDHNVKVKFNGFFFPMSRYRAGKNNRRPHFPPPTPCAFSHPYGLLFTTSKYDTVVL